MQKITFDNKIGDISLIGDIHGDYGFYDDAASRLESSIQLGDFGFEFDVLKNHDPKLHRVLGGNHDNYDEIVKVPHYLGDYGSIEWNDKNIFFVRGAASIDKMYRTIGIDWWADEELSNRQMESCMNCYREQKPDVLITHCPPKFAVEWFVKPMFFPKTELFFQHLHDVHKPKIHIFAHMHYPMVTVKDGTKFISVGINQVVSLKEILET